jgi:hypothetical protein
LARYQDDVHPSAEAEAESVLRNGTRSTKTDLGRVVGQIQQALEEGPAGESPILTHRGFALYRIDTRRITAVFGTRGNRFVVLCIRENRTTLGAAVNRDRALDDAKGRLDTWLQSRS